LQRPLIYGRFYVAPRKHDIKRSLPKREKERERERERRETSIFNNWNYKKWRFSWNFIV